jgi:hypothetical protein
MTIHLRDCFQTFDKVRYIGWCLMPLTTRITVRLQTGEFLSVRRPPEPDLHTAHEVSRRRSILVHVHREPVRSDESSILGQISDVR